MIQYTRNISHKGDIYYLTSFVAHSIILYLKMVIKVNYNFDFMSLRSSLSFRSTTSKAKHKFEENPAACVKRI